MDPVIERIVDYVSCPPDFSERAWETARLCVLDSLGCALLARDYPACRRLVEGRAGAGTTPAGAVVPGTALRREPVAAAFDIGAMVRWLDYNDTWLAAEWGHPSDNLGAILAAADWTARGQRAAGRTPLTMRDVFAAQIRAHEIQGVLALDTALNRHGIDHVVLVRVATSAVAAALLGADRQTIAAAVSNAWLDGGPPRAYRHAPNVGPRKSWAAGDATARGVWQALLALAGEPGYATPLTAPRWGFQDALLGGEAITLARPLGSYVMENVLFKVAYPAEFHAQTAAEAAIALHPHACARLDDIDEHASAGVAHHLAEGAAVDDLPLPAGRCRIPRRAGRLRRHRAEPDALDGLPGRSAVVEHAQALETHRRERVEEARLGQRAGDTAAPQHWITAQRLGHLAVADDVADDRAAARAQHAEELAEHRPPGPGVHEVEHAFGDHDIDARVGNQRRLPAKPGNDLLEVTSRCGGQLRVLVRAVQESTNVAGGPRGCRCNAPDSRPPASMFCASPRRSR